MQTGRYTSADTHNRTPARPVAFSGIAQQALVALNAIGFDRPVAFLLRNDAARVKAVVDYVMAQPPGSFRNPAGFVRSRVANPAPIPAVRPMDPADKFKNQRHDHLIQR